MTEATKKPRKRKGTWRCENCNRTFDMEKVTPDSTVHDADICRGCVIALWSEDG